MDPNSHSFQPFSLIDGGSGGSRGNGRRSRANGRGTKKNHGSNQTKQSSPGPGQPSGAGQKSGAGKPSGAGQKSGAGKPSGAGQKSGTGKPSGAGQKSGTGKQQGGGEKGKGGGGTGVGEVQGKKKGPEKKKPNQVGPSPAKQQAAGSEVKVIENSNDKNGKNDKNDRRTKTNRRRRKNNMTKKNVGVANVKKEPSIAQQVLSEPLMRLTILKHLNPYNIDDLKGIISLKQLGLLPTDELRYYFDTCMTRKPMISAGETSDFSESAWIMKELGLDVLAERFYLHPKMEPWDIKSILRDQVLVEESETRWLKKKKRDAIWAKYGFLSYVPKELYNNIRVGQRAIRDFSKKKFRQSPANRSRHLPDAADLLGEVVLVGAKDEVIRSLITTYGADPHECYYDGYIKLHHLAAAMGHTNTLRHLVECCGLDPKEECKGGSYSGCTLAHFAAGSGRIDTLRYVCEELGVFAEKEADNGVTPIYMAATSGNVLCVEYLADQYGHDPGKADNMGISPILMAADLGYLKIVETLAGKYKVNIQSTDMNGGGLIHYAMQGGQVHLLPLLAETYNLDVNVSLVDAEQSIGVTPLFVAVVDARSTACVRALVEKYGADPKAVDFAGATLAHHAARVGAVSVIRLLFDEYKLDPRTKTTAEWGLGEFPRGTTCADWAKLVGEQHVFEVLEDEYEVEFSDGGLYIDFNDEYDDDSDDEYDDDSDGEFLNESLFFGDYGDLDYEEVVHETLEGLHAILDEMQELMSEIDLE